MIHGPEEILEGLEIRSSIIGSYTSTCEKSILFRKRFPGSDA